MAPSSTVPHPAEAAILAGVDDTVIERVRRLQLMAFDVDGVLTDGLLWYGNDGEIAKSFHVHDGHGLRLLKESGVHVALITGRESAIVARRGAELGMQYVLQGIRDKGQALLQLCHELGIDTEQTGFMGDDLIDLPAMQRAGFAACVPDAPAYVAQAAHWVANLPGGAGAVRECCELILASQGRLAAFFDPQAVLMPGAIQ